MSIQDARLTVEAELTPLLPDGWQVSTETAGPLFSGLIQVGHVTNVAFASYGAATFNLYVTVWVNEADDIEAAAKLYTLISPGPGSVFWQWWQSSTLSAGAPEVERVGTFTEGPTRFLAAVVRVPITIPVG